MAGDGRLHTAGGPMEAVLSYAVLALWSCWTHGQKKQMGKKNVTYNKMIVRYVSKKQECD